MGSAALTRPLGHIENYYYLLDQVCSAGFAIVGHLEGRLSPERLRLGLETLQNLHPQLRNQIVWSGRPFFALTEAKIPLEVLPRSHPNHWLETVQDHLAGSFPSGPGPLLRVLLLVGDDKTDLILRFHHSLCDATSGFLLLNQLLQLCGGQSSALPQSSVLDSIESFLPYAAQQYVNDFEFSEPIRSAADLQPCSFTHRRLPAEYLQVLLDSCRAHGTTVHGALCAAMLKVTAETIWGDGPAILTSPVSIRGHIPEAQRNSVALALGFFAGRFDPGADFWPLAGDIQKRISDQLESYAYMRSLAFALSKLVSTGEPLSDCVGRAQSEGRFASVSNLGVANLERAYAGPIVKNVHFLVAIATLGPGFFVSANSFAECLSLNFTYRQPFIETSQAEKMADDVVTTLLGT